MSLSETSRPQASQSNAKPAVFVDGASGTTGLGINERLRLQSDVIVKAIAEDKRKDAGAKRALRLSVSGAFHSPLMEPVEIAFSGAIRDTAFADPDFAVYSNVTAQPCTSAAEARTLLLRQLTAPVRWSDEVRAMAAAYPGALYVELGPGNVLSGLVSRIVAGARTIAVGAPADVDRLAEALG